LTLRKAKNRSERSSLARMSTRIRPCSTASTVLCGWAWEIP